jgi:hypothetical protein
MYHLNMYKQSAINIDHLKLYNRQYRASGLNECCMLMQVTLTPAAAGVSFQPHPQHDSCTFDSMSALVQRLDTQGYYGGIRLLMVSVAFIVTGLLTHVVCTASGCAACCKQRYAETMTVVHADVAACRAEP